MSKSIRDILARRNDLSTFVVHLTKDGNGKSARDNLVDIVHAGKIEARNAHGHGIYNYSNRPRFPLGAYKAVCFTETPLEYIYLFTEEIIEDRSQQFENYGIAITKAIARKTGLNPIMYVDMTPGHDWEIAHALNAIIEEALTSDIPADHPIFKIAPFIEQMGTWKSGKKEFWWEREWRKVDYYKLPDTYIVICPQDEQSHILQNIPEEKRTKLRFIDATWGLEEIIARLAGFVDEDIHLFK